jgi:ubiquinone/menaquinone biosynthesis C-methylase UbiE
MQFDQQADTYDKRTGLGEKSAANIAGALKKMITPYSSGMFLEIGAGTGEIGFFLQSLGIPYVGIDLSSGMLDIYRKRFTRQNEIPALIQADANNPWPVENISVSVFFSSRAMHHLNREHVISELERVSVPHNAILILGHVNRSKSSVKTIMRREMHKILHEYGFQEKSGQSNRNNLFDLLQKKGGGMLDPVIVSRWRVSHAPIESIHAWKIVDGIAGNKMSKSIKNQILDRLEVRARTLFYDLNRPQEAEERYELNAIKLP